MTFWGNFAIFETTAKNSVLERWGHCPHLQYEKKNEKIRSKSKVPKSRNSVILVRNSLSAGEYYTIVVLKRRKVLFTFIFTLFCLFKFIFKSCSRQFIYFKFLFKQILEVHYNKKRLEQRLRQVFRKTSMSCHAYSRHTIIQPLLVSTHNQLTGTYRRKYSSHVLRYSNILPSLAIRARVSPSFIIFLYDKSTKSRPTLL